MSAPRSVASEVPSISHLRKPRSQPLATPIRLRRWKNSAAWRVIAEIIAYVVEGGITNKSDIYARACLRAFNKEDAMKRVGSMLFLFGALLFTGCKGKAVHCDEETSRLVAKAYVLSAPFIGRENELIQLAQSNPGYFNKGGRAIRCMRSLGTALMQGGLEQNKQFSSRSTKDLFPSMPEGLDHLTGQVDDSLRSYGSDMYTMGKELIWLGRVLPPAVQGNYTPYRTTGTEIRQMAAQVLPVYQMLCQMDPAACRMMQSMFIEMAPILEQQIYTFARKSGD